MRVHEFVDEGLGHSSYVIDLGDGTAAVVDPPRFPDRPGAPRRIARASARVDVGHAFARRLCDGQPGVGRPVRGDVHRSGRLASRVAAPACSRSRARRPRRGRGTGGAGDAGSHARPSRLPPGRGWRAGRAVLRWFADGRHGRDEPTCAVRTSPCRSPTRCSRRCDASMSCPTSSPVYPTHGAGSFCSAPGASQRTSTLEHERDTNPLFSITDESLFVERLVAGFGTFPTYFARLPEVNRLGPVRYDTLPQLAALDPDDVERHLAAGAVLVDARPVAAFAAGHVPGSLSNTLRPVFASWLGWLVEAGRPVVFVLDEGQDRDDLVRQCLDVGHEHLLGELAGGIDAWTASGRAVATIPLVDPAGDDRPRDRCPPSQRVRLRTRARGDQHRARRRRPRRSRRPDR